MKIPDSDKKVMLNMVQAFKDLEKVLKKISFKDGPFKDLQMQRFKDACTDHKGEFMVRQLLEGALKNNEDK